jgi:leucyl-tRNA synthetase
MVQGMAYRCEEHKWLAVEEVDLTKQTCKHCGRRVESEMRAMSKTKKNGVSPDELFERYGADTAHAAILFLGPVDQDIAYQETGVQGVYRFLRRFWDTVGERAAWIEGAPPFAGGSPLEPWRSLRRKCHEILKRVTEAFETHAFNFNTCISGIMEVLSEIQAAGEPADAVAKSVLREALELAVQMLGPFAPHIAEEMWRQLGRTEPTLFRVAWPEVDPAALEVAEVEIAIQVNRKVRARTMVRKGLSEQEALQVARDLPAIRSLLEGKEIQGVYWVPDRLLNIAVK